jgi:chaperone BCS1
MPGVTNRLKEKKEVAEVNNTNTDNTQGLAYAMMLMAQKEKSDAIMDSYRREKQLAEDKLDIGYILSKLDGLESADGRIIVATTNYPERIDSALLRPGRFGIQLKLGNCTRSMMVDILGMAYQLVDKEEVREKLKNVEEYKISPAELLQLVITKKSVDDVVKHILAM